MKTIIFPFPLSLLALFAPIIFCNLDFAYFEGRGNVRIPAEYEAQDRIYMMWPSPGARESDTTKFFRRLKSEIAHIAKKISNHAPLTLIVNPDQVQEIIAAFSAPQLAKISLVLLPVNDIWARDCLPVFGIGLNSQLIGVDPNYDGYRNGHDRHFDAQLAQRIAENLQISSKSMKLVTEGGALEFDGEGTLLATKSSIVNSNRNPGWTLRQVERELRRVFGIQKIIWFPGQYGGRSSMDIHVDSLVRFVRPGLVVVDAPPRRYSGWQICRECTNDAIQVLKKERDARGRRLEWRLIPQPNPNRTWDVGPRNWPFAPVLTYVNFLIMDEAVILPQFGDEEADEEARLTLEDLFEDKIIIPVPAIYLGHRGGGVHCATKNLPKLLDGEGFLQTCK